GCKTKSHNFNESRFEDILWKRIVARRGLVESKFVDDFGPRIWEKIVANVHGSKRSWDVIGIPCKHVVTVINATKQKVNDYVAKCYKKEAFLASYQFEVPTIEGMSQWKKTGMPLIQPPLTRKMPGRPKKKRVLEEWEASNAPANTEEQVPNSATIQQPVQQPIQQPTPIQQPVQQLTPVQQLALVEQPSKRVKLPIIRSLSSKVAQTPLLDGTLSSEATLVPSERDTQTLIQHPKKNAKTPAKRQKQKTSFPE
ncbi:hypothetical protein SLEP1_g59699, partial [Rubroshorea leprosula]